MIKTYFDPDEYWQSIEIAHSIVFGYGFVTWEWIAQIRSCLFILPFLFAFKLIKWLNLNDFWIIISPKFIQSIIAGLLDVVTIKLSEKICNGNNINQSNDFNPFTKSIIFVNAINWFSCLYYPRTISNVLEALLINSSLLYWPIGRNKGIIMMEKWKNDKSKLKISHDQIHSFSHFSLFFKAIFLAGLSVHVRPSAILFWIFPFVELFFHSPFSFSIKFRLIIKVVFIALLIIILGIILDSHFYHNFIVNTNDRNDHDGIFTSFSSFPFSSFFKSFLGKNIIITWWNFIKINMLYGASNWFGVNPWYFYLLQGIPTLSGLFLPFIPYGLFVLSIVKRKEWKIENQKINKKYEKEEDSNEIKDFENNETVKWIIGYLASGILFNSLIPHKEFRFLLPLQPIFVILSGIGLKSWKEWKISTAIGRKILSLSLVILNFFLIVYFARYHQSAPIHIAYKIRQIIDKEGGEGHGFLFLTPCHSTPAHGLIHRKDAILRFLDCTVKWQKKDENYNKREIKKGENDNNHKFEFDESMIKRKNDTEEYRFYKNPITFLSREIFSFWRPSHIIIFESLLVNNDLRIFLEEEGYHKEWSIWNGPFSSDDRTKGNLIIMSNHVYQRKRDSQP